MNKTYAAASSLLLLFSSASFAETTEKPMGNMGMGQGMGMGMMHQGMGMGMNMTEEQKNQHLQAMQEHMLQMHDLSNQILAEKDPAKKAALKTKQLELMKAHHAQMMGNHMQMKMKMQHQPQTHPEPKDAK